MMLPSLAIDHSTSTAMHGMRAGASSPDKSQQARDTACRFVATAFFAPLLQGVRNDPLKSDLFHGGFGEDTFGQQLDTVFADAIVERLDQPEVGKPFALVQQIYESVLKHQQADDAGETLAEGGLDVQG